MQPDQIPSLRRSIVEMAHRAGDGHVPSSLSILDIVYVLYTDIMGPNDMFVLSKGHGCLALYVVLADTGIIPADWLDRFCQPGAPLQGHPERGVPGIHFGTGSLGHGICGAVGLAYAKRVKGEPGRVFCLIGDGEAQEGSVLEAMRLADDLGLDNLTVIVDMNEAERAKHARRLQVFAPHGTWTIDGHDHRQISTAMKRQYFQIVLAKTIKGHGIPEMEADPRAWHHRTAGLGEILDRMP